MTIQEAYTRLMYQLFQLYDDRESANIADMVIEHITGFRKIDRVLNKQVSLNREQESLLANYTDQLLQHTPVQYVLHEAWFSGMKFFVNEAVLIPRPETEELVDWIVAQIQKSKVKSQKILDIGTGSGCIPVALKKKLPQLDVHALDVSKAALNVAQQNAVTSGTEIIFHEINILDTNQWYQLQQFDIIVSNPPYIKQSEATEMRNNVLQHEPHIALFVPDNDALLFYKTIAAFGLQHLNTTGQLFLEINELYAKEVRDVLSEYGYSNIELKKDMQGKDRMIKAALLTKK